MSGSSQSRRKSKHKLEPISYEEMLGTAGMSGFVSFLDVTPADANRTPEGPGYIAAHTEGTQREPLSHAKRELATASETSSPPRIATSQPTPFEHERGTPDIGIRNTIPSAYADQDGCSFTYIHRVYLIQVYPIPRQLMLSKRLRVPATSQPRLKERNLNP